MADVNKVIAELRESNDLHFKLWQKARGRIEDAKSIGAKAERARIIAYLTTHDYLSIEQLLAHLSKGRHNR